MADQGESKASRALDRVLNQGGEVADRIKEAIHRTQLWRFRTGRGNPDANTIAVLHRLSDGAIAASQWGDEDALDESA